MTALETATAGTATPALSPTDVQWHDCGQDPNGRLFFHEGRLFRAMKRHDAAFYERLLHVVRNHETLAGGVVPTEIADLRMDGATVVLEHERIDPVPLPCGWSPRMFRDAALLHCDVHLELARAGFNLQDAHLWNVGFKHAAPLFLDFGSIIERDSPKLRRTLLGEYRSYMVHPLVLMCRGEYARARRYLHESNPPLQPRDLVGYFGIADGIQFLHRSATQTLRARRDVARMVQAVRDQIETMTPTKGRSPWDGYHDDESARAEADWHGKQRHVVDLVNKLRPKTLLDFGCATGWYAAQAAEAGCRVVALDVDHGMIDHVYQLAAARRLPITPVVGDLFAGINPIAGFEADMVLALAVVHHLVLTQGLTFRQVVRVLARYASRWLVTEFINRNDAFVKRQPADLLERYDLDTFIAALREQFSQVESFPSSSDNRTVLLCTK